MLVRVTPRTLHHTLLRLVSRGMRIPQHTHLPETRLEHTQLSVRRRPSNLKRGCNGNPDFPSTERKSFPCREAPGPFHLRSCWMLSCSGPFLDLHHRETNPSASLQESACRFRDPEQVVPSITVQPANSKMWQNLGPGSSEPEASKMPKLPATPS